MPDINKIKKERKLPKPDFFIPDAQYVTSGNGYPWDLRQFMDFRFWSPPFFNSKETKQHKSAVYMAVEIINSGKLIKFDCIDHWLGSEEHKDNDKVDVDNLYEDFLKNYQK